MDVEPVFGQALQARNFVANFIVENLGPATGNGIQTRIAQARNRVANRHAAVFGDGDDLRSGITMEMNFREALLDAAQHLLVPVDLQIGMQSALHQHAGASEFDRFADLLVDGLEFEDVSLFGLRPLQGAVKRAKRAIFGAIVRVIDIAIDDVSDHALGMEFRRTASASMPMPTNHRNEISRELAVWSGLIEEAW